MADQTLTGCVDFSTGLATFDQDDCEYFGCMVFKGVHAGQVAVTILSTTCDDIFYGCVDLSTGLFEVVVPDDCCTFAGCTSCPDAPGNLYVTTSGISVCDSDGCTELHFVNPFFFNTNIEDIDSSKLNQKFLLANTSNCVYTAEIFVGQIYRTRAWIRPQYHTPIIDCSGEPDIEFSGDTVKLELSIGVGGLELEIWAVDSTGPSQVLIYDSGAVSRANCDDWLTNIPNTITFPEPNPFCDARVIAGGVASISER